MPTEKQRKHIEELAKVQKSKATFRSDDEFTAAFETYLSEVGKEGWKMPPSYTSFARRLECSATSIYRFLSKHPEAEKTSAQMLADCIVEGAMQGKYRETTSIFALKNRCGWSDKRETASITRRAPDIATSEEAQQNVRRIMYSLGMDPKGKTIRSKEAQKHLDEIEDRIIKLAEAKA